MEKELLNILRLFTRRKKSTSLITILISVLLTIGIIFFAEPIEDPDTQGGSDLNLETSGYQFDMDLIEDSNLYKVSRVIDGDTIEIVDGDITEKVRLLGIDTPETSHPTKGVECFGKEATEYLSLLIEDQSVYLVADSTQSNVDRYDRLVRYVVLEDGTFVNYEMIAGGFAFEYTYNLPYLYTDDFQLAEQIASENEIGLWGDACEY